MQACLDIDDGTKERLNCYDAIFPPTPKPKPPAVKGVTDCRFIKEEDERLACFNKFAEKLHRCRGMSYISHAFNRHPEDVNVCVIPGCARLGADPASSTGRTALRFRVRAER